MTHDRHHPAVHATWSLRVEKDADFPVLPDGSVDLITLTPPSAPPRVLLSGLDLSPRRVHLEAGTRLDGLRLRPGVDLRPLGFVPAESLGRVIDVTDGQEAMTGALERCLGSHLEAIDLLTASPLSVAAVARDLGVTPRTLHRHVTNATGLSPVVWRDLGRAKRAANSLIHSDAPLVETALDLGYADQAHMTRSLKRWFGVPPGKLARCAETGALFRTLGLA